MDWNELNSYIFSKFCHIFSILQLQIGLLHFCSDDICPKINITFHHFNILSEGLVVWDVTFNNSVLSF